MHNKGRKTFHGGFRSLNMSCRGLKLAVLESISEACLDLCRHLIMEFSPDRLLPPCSPSTGVACLFAPMQVGADGHDAANDLLPGADCRDTPDTLPAFRDGAAIKAFIGGALKRLSVPAVSVDIPATSRTNRSSGAGTGPVGLCCEQMHPYVGRFRARTASRAARCDHRRIATPLVSPGAGVRFPAWT